MAATNPARATPEMRLQVTIIRRRSTRSASTPAGNAAIAAPALFAAVTPAMTRGLRVSVTVKSGNATATRPSPLAEIPVAHQRRQNDFPKRRRGPGASAVEGASTLSSGGWGGPLSGASPISRATRSTEVNEHLPDCARSDCAPNPSDGRQVEPNATRVALRPGWMPSGVPRGTCQPLPASFQQ